EHGRAREAGVAGQRQAAGGLDGGGPAAGDRLLPLLRGLGGQDRRKDDPDQRSVFLLHAARAGGGGRADYSVEFSAADAGVEVGSGAGGGLHQRDDAGGAAAAVGAANGGAGAGGRRARRRH